MKKIFTTLLLIMAAASLWAYDAEVDGVYYNLNSTDNTAEVTYKTTSYISYSGFVVIPDVVIYSDKSYTVISIGKNAFRSSTNLTKVIIPTSVTSIGVNAFYECTGLTSISIPNSVTSIDDGAFYGCTGLTSVTIPTSVTSIGVHAFSRCYGLTSVSIGNSVTSIGAYAFYGCSGLTSVTIPNSVTSIGDYAFYQCFGLTSVSIGNSVTSIGDVAFSGCFGLTSVTIPTSVTSIGEGAFNRCSLTSVTIPNSVTSIGIGAFCYCTGLTSINVDSGNTKYDSRNDCNAIIESSTNSLIIGCKSTVIPTSVTSIGEGAFYGCSGLTSITIPTSVTEIGDGAFAACRGLTSITIPNSVTSIGDAAFSGCSGLTSITIPTSVTSIGLHAFSGCSGLISVTNLATKPQTINSETFSKYGTLHVYKGYKDVYQKADYWKNFTIVDDIEITVPTTFKLDQITTHLGRYKTYIITYTSDSPLYIEENGLTLTSSDENIVVTDNASKKIAGIADGIATVTVCVNGTELKDYITVYVGSAQPSTISNIKNKASSDRENIYSVSGQKLNSTQRGIIIINGKKHIIR